MGSFLKKILEPSEQDVFGHLTWTDKPCCISIFEGLCSEDVQPSANVGLPGPLIPRQPPGPAYVTHTGPVVRGLRLQDGLDGAAPARRDPRDAGAEERTPARGRGGSAAGTEDSVAIPEGRSSLTPPGVCHKILFARRAPSAALPRSSPACSCKRE